MTYLERKVNQILGHVYVAGERDAIEDYGDWSPNTLKQIIIGGGQIRATHHDGSVHLLDFDEETAKRGKNEDVFSAFRNRMFGNLESVEYDTDLISKGTSVFDGYKKYRLREINGAEVGNEDWITKINARPSTYPIDAEIKNLFPDIGVSSEEVESEEEEVEEVEEDPERELIEAVATEMVLGRIDDLLESYDQIFASGYEVIQPYGVLSINSRGMGTALRLEGEKLAPAKYAGSVQESFGLINQYLNLEVKNTRDIEQIVHEVLNAPDGTNLYFPKKMLEYAYGRERAKSSETGDDNFPRNAHDVSWEAYRENELFKSLKDVYLDAAVVTVKEKGLLDSITTPESRNIIGRSLDKITKALGTVLLVSKYEVLNQRPSQLKLRVLDPTHSLPTNKNLATEAIVKATSSTGGRDSLSIEVIKDGSFYEFYHQTDRSLANAAPLFAYKALESLKRKGVKPNMDNLILGIDEEDSILQAGPSGIDLSQNLIHWVIAGSRAGKGVMTQNILASGDGSGLPLFYLDRAPDISSTLLKIYPGAFVVNGGSMLSGDGRDHWKAFADANNWVNWSHIPDYIPVESPSQNYVVYGDIFYARALLFIMGILVARVTSTKHLGGDKGLMIVIDELKNASDGLQNSFLTPNVGSHYHPQNYQTQKEYADAINKWNEDKEAGLKPPKPSRDGLASEAYEGSAWYTDFLDALKSSFRTLSASSSAGMKDNETRRSNIFVLSQQIHSTSRDSSEIFPTKNKSSFGRGFSFQPNDVLASIINVTGNADAFFGFNKDDSERNILGQLTPGSYASTRLDEKARKFAYVSKLNEKTISEISKEETARAATFFKPFLIFADGREDQYFVQNARNFMEAAGVDWASVVEENEDDQVAGTINRKVGYEEYVKAMGRFTPPEHSLKLGAEIANYVAKRMGYPETLEQVQMADGSVQTIDLTWRALIFDLRPQWMFDVSDVVKAIQTGSMRPLKERATESIRLNPSLAQETKEEDGWGQDWQTEEGDDEFPIEVVDLDSEGHKTEVIDVDHTPTGESGTFSPDQTPEGTAGDFTPGFPETIPLPNPFTVPPITPGGSTFDSTAYGKGTAPGADGRPEPFDVLEEREVFIGATYSGDLGGYEILSKMLTDYILKYVGGKHMVRSIRVVGGSVIINDKAHKVVPNREYMDHLAPGIVSELDAGNLAPYFDWKKLIEFDNLVSLSFDSPNFVLDEIAPALGWNTGKGISKIVPQFFYSLPSLNRLSISGSKYNRSTLREDIKNDEVFYQASKGEKLLGISERFFQQGFTGSWMWARKGWKKGDGLFISAGKHILGAAGSVASGGAYLGVQAGKGIGGKLRQGLDMISSSFRN